MKPSPPERQKNAKIQNSFLRQALLQIKYAKEKLQAAEGNKTSYND